MKRILIFQILILLAGSFLLYFYGSHHDLRSFASGVILVVSNFILLGLGWKMVFRKKLIALSVLIIVFKYAILGVIIYHLVKQTWLQPFWFAAGVTSMMFASLIYGLTFRLFEKDNEV